jgi:hypothetical protein
MIGIETTISPDVSNTQRSVTSPEEKQRLDKTQWAVPVKEDAKSRLGSACHDRGL